MMSLPKKVKSDSQQSDTSSEGIEHLQDIDFTRKSRWNAFQLKVEDKDLYVPKSHLALVSPVFRLMFESNFKEKDIDVLPLPGKKYEDVLIFLKCTHPGALVKVTYDVVPKVLPLAHEYQVKWLLDDCTNVMMMEMNTSSYVEEKPVPTFNSYIVGFPLTRGTCFPSTNSTCFSSTNTTCFPSTNTTSDLYTEWCNICIMAEKYGLNCVVERFIQRCSSVCYTSYKDLPEFKKISIEVRYRVVCERLLSTDK